MKLYIKWLSILVCSIMGFQSGCKDGITGPPFPAGNYQICYCGYGQIKINNILGTDPVNISIQDTNYKSGYYDDYPQWSRDGRYIVFQRLRPDTIYNPFIYVYDTQNKTYTNLTSDGGIASSSPQWAPNGKVYFSYESPVLNPTATYMMNPDRSDKKKILDDSAASIFFFQDSYTFLYRPNGLDGTQIYKTNTDGTFNELVLDLPQPGSSQFVTLRDFDPLNGQFLVNTNIISGSPSAIATLSSETKQFSVVLTADPGWTVILPQYSSDYSIIAFIEYDSTQNEYLSVLKSGSKHRLAYLPGDTVGGRKQFSWYPPRFSPDSKYLAYDELVYGSGQWVNFQQYLYVIDVTTGNVQYVDKGFDVSWNPRQ